MTGVNSEVKMSPQKKQVLTFLYIISDLNSGFAHVGGLNRGSSHHLPPWLQEGGKMFCSDRIFTNFQIKRL